jgi:hypothetical protein
MSNTMIDDRTPNAMAIDFDVEPANRRVVFGIIAIGVTGDVALRSGFVTAGGAIAIVVVAAALLWSGRLVRVEARLLALAAPMFGVFLALRQSPWLIPFDVAAAVGLFVVASMFAHSGSLFDVSPLNFCERSLHGLAHSSVAPAFVAQPLRGRRSGAVLRGVLLAVPIVVVLVALLASADRVFATLLGLDSLDVGDVFAHVVLFCLAAWIGAAFLRVASANEPTPVGPMRRVLGALEAAIVLGAVGVLLGVFAVAQLLDAFGTAEHIVEARNIDYAEYARSGFFQLLWVAGIVIVVVMSVRALTRSDGSGVSPMIVRLGVLNSALTVLVVAVSIKRLALYQDEYGLTMLRLYSTAAAYAIGVILVLVALTIAGVGAGRVWLPGAVVIVGLVALFALNIVNPEAYVARANLERSEPMLESEASGYRGIDRDYLLDLSPDAVPTIVARLDRLAPDARAHVIDALCDRPATTRNWISFNRSTDRARAALDTIC